MRCRRRRAKALSRRATTQHRSRVEAEVGSSLRRTKQPPRSKKERRELREERKAPSASARASGEAATSAALPETAEASFAAAPTVVHVSVDLRVLLKLAKATAAPCEAEQDTARAGSARRKPKGGGNRNRNAPQLKEPVCCVFLRCHHRVAQAPQQQQDMAEATTRTVALH